MGAGSRLLSETACVHAKPLQSGPTLLSSLIKAFQVETLRVTSVSLTTASVVLRPCLSFLGLAPQSPTDCRFEQQSFTVSQSGA